ncbi:hypothetical protein KUV47_10565 [Vannielia litorea]|uniref:hypothetical protein n=1 Tax=Vannielia litorea TaxID=1217970 RepID=UPI001C982352|nr:hypothetical protein [Vannielia litorea]MBY6153655.1 hypothetical protein [Vannielia litorea]
MKRPSRQFLSDDIAAHLDERTLSILAEAESFQEWDRRQQLTLFKVPRENASALLGWLSSILATGNAKYGDRWSAGISIAQAHNRLLPEDTSDAAQELRALHDRHEAVIQSVLTIVSPDDSLDPLFAADLMAGERIATRALYAAIEDRVAPTDLLVRTALQQVREDTPGR